MSDSYRVLIGDVVYGPMSQDQLEQLILSGRVSAKHSLSKNDGPWSSIANYPAVKRNTVRAAVPPPLPSATGSQQPLSTTDNESEWFYAKDGASVGPVTSTTIREMLATGEISHETIIWCPGQTDWIRLADSDFGKMSSRPLSKQSDVWWYRTAIYRVSLCAAVIAVFLPWYSFSSSASGFGADFGARMSAIGFVTLWGIIAFLLSAIGLVASFVIPYPTNVVYRHVLVGLAGGVTAFATIGIMNVGYEGSFSDWGYGGSVTGFGSYSAKASAGPSIGVYITLIAGIIAALAFLLPPVDRLMQRLWQPSRSSAGKTSSYILSAMSQPDQVGNDRTQHPRAQTVFRVVVGIGCVSLVAVFLTYGTNGEFFGGHGFYGATGEPPNIEPNSDRAKAELLETAKQMEGAFARCTEACVEQIENGAWSWGIADEYMLELGVTPETWAAYQRYRAAENAARSAERPVVQRYYAERHDAVQSAEAAALAEFARRAAARREIGCELSANTLPPQVSEAIRRGNKVYEVRGFIGTSDPCDDSNRLYLILASESISSIVTVRDMDTATVASLPIQHGRNVTGRTACLWRALGPTYSAVWQDTEGILGELKHTQEWELTKLPTQHLQVHDKWILSCHERIECPVVSSHSETRVELTFDAKTADRNGTCVGGWIDSYRLSIKEKRPDVVAWLSERGYDTETLRSRSWTRGNSIYAW